MFFYLFIHNVFPAKNGHIYCIFVKVILIKEPNSY